MRIHFIAIGGAVMHNMAIALKKKGYEVTGSDDEIFDPARSNLEKNGILPKTFGWFPERITPDIDAVILGMHAKKGNPELDKAVELGLKIYSFPKYLYEQSKDKTRVVIAGSHGKTTITSMVMHILKHAGLEFDYLVGAKIDGFDIMVKLSDAPIIVIEGDEYLTSALDPRPKFLHYKPHVALISGVAWDHINVFPTWEGYKEQFELLIGEIEKEGSLVYCAADDVLAEIVDSSCEKEICPQHVLSYNLPGFIIENGITKLIKENGEKRPLVVFGKHNLLNIEGARLVCQRLGIGGDTFMEAIRTFKGSANRLELIHANQTTAMYKDFAHAPSKLKATAEAVKQQYPGRKLIAVMELHTYSSLSKNFLGHYAGGLDSADVPVVFFSKHALALKKLPEISEDDVKDGFNSEKIKVFTDPDQLKNFLEMQNYQNTNLLMMSSGNFGGLKMEQLKTKIFD